MSYSMLIDGCLVQSESCYPVVNPATEELIAQAPDCSKEQLDAAVTAAKAAQAEWAVDEEKRRAVLVACADALRANAESLAAILTAEQGKPLAKAQNEIMGAAAWLSYSSTLESPVDIIKDDDASRVEIHRRPLGVVAGIVPWNYPVMTTMWKLAPAMMAGNTVVLKSSPYTPLATLKVAELFKDIIPPGVANFLSGGDDLGKWMSAHPGVAKVSFTGSTRAGKSVAASASNDLKRLLLELGGNDAAIVLPGVDPKTVAQKLYTAAFENCGQVCVAIKRIYIHKEIYPAVVAELKACVESAVVGNGTDPEVTVGPLNNAAQLARVMELAEDAKADGGQFITGGERMGDKGYFYAPTLVTGLPRHSRLVVEEQFGPIVPLLEFSDIDELIAHLNQSKFGLAGSVWSPDVAEATAIAARLETGTVWINQHLAMIPQAPVSGRKWSGVGVENGQLGFESYSELQTLSIAKS